MMGWLSVVLGATPSTNVLLVGIIVLAVLIGAGGYMLSLYRARLQRGALFGGIVGLVLLTGLTIFLLDLLMRTDRMAGFVVVFTLAIMLVILFFSWERARARAEALAPVAKELGFIFYPGSALRHRGLRLPPRPVNLGLGSSVVASNVLQGSTRGVRVTIFDYDYTRRRGALVQQTVLQFESEEVTLPPFHLRPRQGQFGMSNPNRAVVGDEVDIEGAEGFSERCLLWSTDPRAVCALFDARVLAAFEADPGVTLDSRESCLSVYRRQVRVAAGELKEVLEEGYRIYALFADAAAHAGNRGL